MYIFILVKLISCDLLKLMLIFHVKFIRLQKKSNFYVPHYDLYSGKNIGSEMRLYPIILCFFILVYFEPELVRLGVLSAPDRSGPYASPWKISIRFYDFIWFISLYSITALVIDYVDISPILHCYRRKLSTCICYQWNICLSTISPSQWRWVIAEIGAIGEFLF